MVEETAVAVVEVGQEAALAAAEAREAVMAAVAELEEVLVEAGETHLRAVTVFKTAASPATVE